MKKKDINEQVARFVGKSPLTIKGWQTHHPVLWDLVTLGAFCKENNLTEEEIVKLIELKELIRGKE